VMYASFKYGQGEREDNGRVFTDMCEGEIAGLLRENGAGGLRVMQEWISEDQRRERNDRWVNVIIEKIRQPH